MNYRVRKLTPIECERLHGYPDNHTKFGMKEDGTVFQLSDAKRYKLCGNGISSPVSKHILEALIPDEKVRVMSLFSGTAGTELLLDKRFEVVGHSEFDNFASANLHYNFPNIKNYGDITKIDGRELPEFDMLIGGFPCQPFSSAGLRNGFDDENRGQLIYDVFRIIRNVKPKYLVLENVKGLLTHNGGESILAIFEGISNLGYQIDFNLVNSKNFGVPQSRERVFVICVRNDIKIDQKPTENLVKIAQRLHEKSLNDQKINLVQMGIPNHKDTTAIDVNSLLEKQVDNKYFVENKIIHVMACASELKRGLAALKTKRSATKEIYDQETNVSGDSETIQLFAYSKSTRDNNIDHRVRIGLEANTLSTGDGCCNMSTQNFVVVKQ